MTTTTTHYSTDLRELPEIRKLEHNAPAHWLSQGLEDLKVAKLHSLIYGLVFTIAGLFLIWQGSSSPLLTLFMITAFVVLGPLAAVGMYDMSARIQAGQPPSLLNAISALKNNTVRLIGFAVILSLILLAWAVAASSIVNTFFGDSDLMRGSWGSIQTSSQSIPMGALVMLGGLVLALIAAAVSILSIPVATRKGKDLLTAAVILIVLLLAWARLTAMVFGLFFDQNELVSGGWSSLYHNPDFIPFIITFLICATVLAAFVFTISVLTVPCLSQTQVSIWTAVSTSIRAILKNPLVMARWAATLALLILAGMGFFFIGLVITLPLAGHASWHAWRETVVEEQIP